MNARQLRRSLPVVSRDSRAVRRAPLAAAAVAVDPAEAQALACLVGHVLRDESEPSPDARRRLRAYRVTLRRTGRAHLAALEAALRADGGATLRTLARVAPDLRSAAAAGAVKLLRAVAEHGVKSSTALDLLVRSMLEGVAADAALARVLAGVGGADEACVATRLGTASRMNFLQALQCERSARDAREAARGPIDLGAVLEAAQPTATRVAVDGDEAER